MESEKPIDTGRFAFRLVENLNRWLDKEVAGVQPMNMDV